MNDVVTIGETMALFGAAEVGPLRHATSMKVSAVGAESNVAIGMRRLGYDTAWIGRVGDDELGELVLTKLRSQGVDTSAVVVDPTEPTGLMVKEQRTSDVTRVYYYRRQSAGSRLAVTDVDDGRIAAARLLHVTGITPALSASAYDAVRHAVDVARASSTLVSFDANYRAALWAPDEAIRTLRELATLADLVFASEDEAVMMTGVEDPTDAARQLAALGPRHAVVKLGARGAVCVVDGVPEQAPAVVVRAVDSVGAGDAFVAGYLSGVLDGTEPSACLSTGCIAGAFAVTVPGDWEGLPTRAELRLLSERQGTVVR